MGKRILSIFLVTLILFLVSCSNSQVVKIGDTVKVEYTGQLDSGEIFDSSVGREPIQFVVGSNQVIKGFSDGVIGLKVNEEKDIRIPPEDAYGELNPQLLQQFPRAQLPQDRVPEVGMRLFLRTQTGQQAPAIITEVNEENITVDLNHPLAGQTLNFKIKVVEIKSS